MSARHPDILLSTHDLSVSKAPLLWVYHFQDAFPVASLSSIQRSLDHLIQHHIPYLSAEFVVVDEPKLDTEPFGCNPIRACRTFLRPVVPSNVRISEMSIRVNEAVEDDDESSNDEYFSFLPSEGLAPDPESGRYPTSRMASLYELLTRIGAIGKMVSNSDPVLAVTLVRFQCGEDERVKEETLLVMTINASIADATCFALVMKAWISVHNAIQKGEEVVVDGNLVEMRFERPPFVPLPGWEEREILTERMRRFGWFKNPDFPPLDTPEVALVEWKIPLIEIIELKEEVQRMLDQFRSAGKLDLPSFVSTHDLVSAFLWKLRVLIEEKPLENGLDVVFPLYFHVNLRGRHPVFPRNFFGNAVAQIWIERTRKEILQMTIPELAILIRSELLKFKQREVQEILEEMERRAVATDPQPLYPNEHWLNWTHMNDWRSIRADDVRFEFDECELVSTHVFRVSQMKIPKSFNLIWGTNAQYVLVFGSIVESVYSQIENPVLTREALRILEPKLAALHQES